MRNKIVIIFFVWVIGFSWGVFLGGKHVVGAWGSGPEAKHIQLVLESVTGEKEADVTEPEEAERADEDKTTQKKEGGGAYTPPKETVPLKKFEPSEKIEADNAVDFPVDI
jgi:hypothetical protein